MNTTHFTQITDFLEKIVPNIFNLIINNNFIFYYFCYLLAILLTTSALKLITNCVLGDKLSTMVIVFGIKISIYIFLNILLR